MKFKKIIFCSMVIGAIAAVTLYSTRNSSNSSNAFSSLLLANIEALGTPEADGYSCSVEIQCCGIASNKKISCTGTNKCESLKDGWGRICKGVKCDGKETLC